MPFMLKRSTVRQLFFDLPAGLPYHNVPALDGRLHQGRQGAADARPLHRRVRRTQRRAGTRATNTNF